MNTITMKWKQVGLYQASETIISSAGGKGAWANYHHKYVIFHSQKRKQFFGNEKSLLVNNTFLWPFRINEISSLISLLSGRILDFLTMSCTAQELFAHSCRFMLPLFKGYVCHFLALHIYVFAFLPDFSWLKSVPEEGFAWTTVNYSPQQRLASILEI